MTPSATHPWGSLTRQPFSSSVGAGMPGPLQTPTASLASQALAAPGNHLPRMRRAPGATGSFPSRVSSSRPGARHARHFGCDGRWPAVTWLCPTCRSNPSHGPGPWVPASGVPRGSATTGQLVCRGAGLSILGSCCRVGTQVCSCRSERDHGRTAVSWPINGLLILF